MRASLDKIGTLLFEDDEKSGSSHSHDTFLLTPISIPIDWLVIVGSYMSLSIAIVGVKAKQAAATNPTISDVAAKNTALAASHSSPAMAYDSNGSIYPAMSQTLIHLQSTPPPNLRMINSVPLLPTPSNMPLLVSTANPTTAPNLSGLSSRQLKEQMSMPPPQIIPAQQISPPQQQTQQYQNHSKMYQQNNANFRQHPYSRPNAAYPNRGNFYAPQTNTYKDSFNRNVNEPNEMDISNETDKESTVDGNKASFMDDIDKVSSSSSSDSSKDSGSSSDSSSDSSSSESSADEMDGVDADEDDCVYTERAESELVKSYFTLTEVNDEKELVEKINSYLVQNDLSFGNLRLNRARNYKLKITDLADAASAASGDQLLDEMNNELCATPLDEYLNEKFNPFYSVDFEYKCTMVRNPVQNHYEHSTNLKSKLEQATNDLAESYLKNQMFIELFDSANRFYHLEVDHVNLLDDLFMDLNRSSQAAYDLFDKLFKLNENLGQLNRIVADFLLNFGARLFSPEKLRELNLGLSYANVLLTKYDENTANTLVTKFHIQSKLLDLFLGKIFGLNFIMIKI